MAVPYTFGNATTSIPLSQLDTNFATAITIGNTAVYLGNTTTSFGNVTLTNATISSGNATVTKITVPTVDAGSGNALTLQSNSTTGLYIDTSQNVGIGTTSPSTKLQVTGHTSGLVAIFDKGAANQAYTQLKNSTQSYNTYVDINNNGGNIWALYDATNSQSMAFYTPGASGFWQFFTQGTERMRIDSSGNLLVGQSSYSATTVGVGVNPAGLINIAQNNSTSGGTGIQIYSTAASAYRFYVTMDGKINCTSTTIAAISDGRLKENVRDLDSGLDAIMALKPRKFDWKTGKGKDIKNDRGFIAQEFETVFPDLIDEWKDPAPEGEEPYKSVRADLIPVLVKAIQEQQAQITSLKAELDALKGTK